jgi:hypothetical protein
LWGGRRVRGGLPWCVLKVRIYWRWLAYWLLDGDLCWFDATSQT